MTARVRQYEALFKSNSSCASTVTTSFAHVVVHPNTTVVVSGVPVRLFVGDVYIGGEGLLTGGGPILVPPLINFLLFLRRKGLFLRRRIWWWQWHWQEGFWGAACGGGASRRYDEFG